MFASGPEAGESDGYRENRQIVADLYAAFGQGDIGAVIDSLTDDVVWINHAPAAAPISGVFHGKDGVQTFFELVNEALDISRFDVRTIVADGDVRGCLDRLRRHRQE
jgi:ketosteroid isomerase-like protein